MMKDIISELKKRLLIAIERNTASGILFSGGLDSTILTAINPNIKAITVSLKSYGEDAKYATSVVRFLHIEHYQRSVEIDEAIDSIPEVIKILGTFDPAIPNDLAVYFGLKHAKRLGIDEVMTGDGADELFAGYDFMKNIEDLDKYIRRISSSMSFSSNKLGDFFNIKIKQPYLDSEFIDFSLSIPVKFKIKEENGEIWGKWILRKAFEDVLPEKIIWQNKRPLEYGSGMRKLREIITSEVSDEEFERKREIYPIKFINKEHLYYYKIYKKQVGKIPEPENNQRACPGCGTGIEKEAFHCQICGWTEPIK